MDKKEAIEVLKDSLPVLGYVLKPAVILAIAAIEESMAQKPDNQQPQGEIADTVAAIKVYKYHGGDPEFVRLIEKLELQLSPSAADVVGNLLADRKGRR